MTMPTGDLQLGEEVPGATPGRPPLQTLLGEFVALEPVDAQGHGPALYSISHGDPRTEALWTYLLAGPFGNGQAMVGWLQRCELSADPQYFTVIDRATNRPVGMVSYLNIVPEMRRLELGNIWYAPSHQRTKTNTEAIYIMLSVTFDVLGYRRAEWKCDVLNERSQAAALRLGFRLEGVFRQHMVVRGRNRDTAWFSMLDTEWPRVKRNMETWLYAPISEGGGIPSLGSLNQGV
jgi:RimJ/RimL family protein N-acetyltransferase